MEVICTGRLTTYAGRSKYQLIVEAMEVAGEGALLRMLEERRRRLAAEGLFDDARKRRLPFLPERIGVITSPTGAVIQDIPAPAGRPVPGTRAGLAGEGPGRRGERRGRPRDPGLQCA